MSDGQPLDRAAIRAKYSPAEAPPCPVCGSDLVCNLTAPTPRVWECWASDPPGVTAADHFARSRWTEPTPAAQVIAILDGLDAAEQERDAARDQAREARSLLARLAAAIRTKQRYASPPRAVGAELDAALAEADRLVVALDASSLALLPSPERSRMDDEPEQALAAAREYLLREAP